MTEQVCGDHPKALSLGRMNMPVESEEGFFQHAVRTEIDRALRSIEHGCVQMRRAVVSNVKAAILTVGAPQPSMAMASSVAEFGAVGAGLSATSVSLGRVTSSTADTIAPRNIMGSGAKFQKEPDVAPAAITLPRILCVLFHRGSMKYASNYTCQCAKCGRVHQLY